MNIQYTWHKNSNIWLVFYRILYTLYMNFRDNFHCTLWWRGIAIIPELKVKFLGDKFTKLYQKKILCQKLHFVYGKTSFTTFLAWIQTECTKCTKSFLQKFSRVLNIVFLVLRRIMERRRSKSWLNVDSYATKDNKDDDVRINQCSGSKLI